MMRRKSGVALTTRIPAVWMAVWHYWSAAFGGCISHSKYLKSLIPASSEVN